MIMTIGMVNLITTLNYMMIRIMTRLMTFLVTTAITTMEGVIANWLVIWMP